MNCIGKITAAAIAGGWTWNREVTGDGYTRMLMTRPDGAYAVAYLRHYRGRPQVLRADLGGQEGRAGVGDVLRYLGGAR